MIELTVKNYLNNFDLKEILNQIDLYKLKFVLKENNQLIWKLVAGASASFVVIYLGLVD
jgi:hypothetical protein